MEAVKGFLGNINIQENEYAAERRTKENDESLWATEAANLIQQEFLKESFFEKLKMSVS